MRATVHTCRYLAVRAGAADHAAFRCLYAMLAPPTLAAIRRDLPDRAQARNVLRGTFSEVWWMLALDRRRGRVRKDVPGWIEAIARQRGRDRRLALDLIARGQPSPDTAAVLFRALADHDSWTRGQLAEMLDGRGTLPPPVRARRRPTRRHRAVVRRIVRPVPGRRPER